MWFVHFWDILIKEIYLRDETLCLVLIMNFIKRLEKGGKYNFRIGFLSQTKSQMFIINVNFQKAWILELLFEWQILILINQIHSILLKVRYIILVDPNGAGFMISNTVLCYGMETLPYVWKIYHKNEWHLHLSFTECVSN